MSKVDFEKTISVDITLGHAIFVWETLSDKFSNLRANDSLCEEERKAIWELTDLIEETLLENGIQGSIEWQDLVAQAKGYMSNLPVGFVDE